MPRRPVRAITATVCTVALLAAGTAAAAPASAKGRDHQRLAPRTHFTMAPDGSSGERPDGAGIPNIDSVKKTVRTYYGAGDDGIANKNDSPYIREMRQIVRAQDRYLDRAMRQAKRHHQRPAIVFDADDTTLWTYDMEDAAMHFTFDPALQDVFVQGQKFPATPSMVGFVNRADRRGFAIFGITGRTDTQEAATVANLEKVGYTSFDAQNFYTKWSGSNPQPAYVTCAAKCTTVEYKAGTRKHIEKDLGYDIVLNVGDQWSDLQGGYADRVLKLPNPTYNLPSPDLDGSPADRAFSPRTHFTMKPDGSSGATQGGEGIPNIDIVKSTIRTYYRATAGIADKNDSPYIREMAR
ncbi:MAG: HAD family acid phosphatase, partial [Aeromicrobium sp.]